MKLNEETLWVESDLLLQCHGFPIFYLVARGKMNEYESKEQSKSHGAHLWLSIDYLPGAPSLLWYSELLLCLADLTIVRL